MGVRGQCRGGTPRLRSRRRAGVAPEGAEGGREVSITKQTQLCAAPGRDAPATVSQAGRRGPGGTRGRTRGEYCETNPIRRRPGQYNRIQTAPLRERAACRVNIAECRTRIAPRWPVGNGPREHASPAAVTLATEGALPAFLRWGPTRPPSLAPLRRRCPSWPPVP